MTSRTTSDIRTADDGLHAVEPNADLDRARRAELVHEARKTIKRMRTLARLLRYELGDEELRRVSASLRAAGQRLADSRDAEVRLATLDRLAARYPDALAVSGVERLRARLVADRDAAMDPQREREVFDDLAGMREEATRWGVVVRDLAAVMPGLKRIYREGYERQALVSRQKGSSVESLHDLRKRVKRLYYALDMLGSEQAEGVWGASRRAERLGDLLGEEHDLWLLSTYIEQHSEAIDDDPSARRTLLKLVDRRRKRLRKRALSEGLRLYRRRPGKFIKRAARSLSPHGTASAPAQK